MYGTVYLWDSVFMLSVLYLQQQVFCTNDLTGYIPISNCNDFRLKSVHSSRLYNIKSTAGTESVKFFLSWLSQSIGLGE